MKKLITALSLSLGVLGSITYGYYRHWHNVMQRAEAIPYIPQSAALVYTVKDVGKQWEAFQQTSLAKALSQIPYGSMLPAALPAGLGVDSKAWKGISLTISAHGLDETQIGYIFYFNMCNAGIQALWETILTKHKQAKEVHSEESKLAGYTITTLQGATHSFAYIRHGHYIMASTAALLLEDVVRGLSHKAHGPGLCLSKDNSRQGSLYINFSKLSQLLRVLIKNEAASTLGTILATFAQANQLTCNLTNHHLLCNGFIANQKTAPTYFMQTLANQTAGPLTVAPYIPNRTAFLQHVTFSNMDQLVAALNQYRQLPLLNQGHSALLTEELAPLVHGEIACCTLAAKPNHPAEQLVFIKVHDSSDFVATLTGFHLLQLLPTSNKQFTCYQLNPKPFYHWLPGKLFPAFAANYLTTLDDYIILANGIDALHTFMGQYVHGKTWKNAAHQQAFLASTLAQANYSLFVNTQKAWSYILPLLKPAWKNRFETHAVAIQTFANVSLQLIYEQPAAYYMSVLVEHREPSQPAPANISKAVLDPQNATRQKVVLTTPLTKTKAAVLTPLQAFQAEAPIITQPFVVKSHRNKELHVLLQDSLYQLYFLDHTGKPHWKRQLPGPITTDIFLIDFYHNNKIQYLFATNNTLHLVDYHGRPVGRYPQKLPHPDQPLHFNVIDYDGSKNYRFIVATTQGAIYLYDKHCHALLGWNPKTLLPYDFAASPCHLKVKDSHYLLFLQKNGTLHALNRKGQSYAGFPLNLQGKVHQPLIVNKAPTDDKTMLTTLSEQGKLCTMNLTGQLQSSVQLAKTAINVRFTLCPDSVTGKRYIVMQQAPDKIVLFDEGGNVRFEKAHIADKALVLQYYDFDPHHQFYVVTDPAKHCAYIYDRIGTLMHPSPLQNDHKLCLVFAKEQNQLIVYSNVAGQALKYILPIE